MLFNKFILHLPNKKQQHNNKQQHGLNRQKTSCFIARRF